MSTEPEEQSSFPLPTVSRRARLRALAERLRVDPPWWVVAPVTAIAVVFVLASVGRLVGPSEPRKITVNLDGTYIVIPTCKELDDIGYDGIVSCIDSDGRIVRAGG